MLRIRVSQKHKSTARARLELYAKLVDEAPQRMEALPRPAGRILADFEEALRRGDDTVASECIAELERNGHLDARNLLYLRIRRNEGREYWQEILDSAQRYNLISASRRPRRVSQAILRAVYATSLASYESNGDAAGALGQFRNVVYPDYAPLLGTRTAYQCWEADAFFLMHAVSEAETSDDVRGALTGIDEDAHHRPWLTALIETLPSSEQEVGTVTAEDAILSAEDANHVVCEVESTSPSDPLLAAREAFFAGALDEAWDLVGHLDPSAASAQLVIACACDVGTLAAAQHALETFARLPSSAREALAQRNSVANNLELLRKLIAPLSAATADKGLQPHIPQNWTEWIEAISANQHWKEAAAVAEQGSLDWDPAEFQKIELVTRFTKALSDLASPGHARILESLPYLLRSISRCDTHPRHLSDALETLTLIHLCDDAPGRLFFGTLADLCNLILSVGVTPHGYTDLLTECISAITNNAGAADFDGLIELLDVLVTYSAPDTPLRAAVASTIAELFIRFCSKAAPIQLVLLRQLLQDAACEVPSALIPDEDAEVAQEEANLLGPLTGKTIALYSLRETVLQRIASLLRGTVEDVTVTTFHDKTGGSAELRSAARHADVFVIAIAAAKHAATNFIERERGSQAVTLKPDGQGSASMLRSLHEYAKSIGGNLSYDS